MICCQKPIGSGWEFCPFCGESLKIKDFAGKIPIVFDLDGVICEQQYGDKDYKNAIPYRFAVENLQKCAAQGFIIKIATARYMQRLKGDRKKVYEKGYVETFDWLQKHVIPFDELYLGKPIGVMFVDDRACRIESAKGPRAWDQFWQEVEKLK